MFFLRRPAPQVLHRLLTMVKQDAFCYGEVGDTAACGAAAIRQGLQGGNGACYLLTESGCRFVTLEV
jgi:hypothetical protein